MLKKPFTLLLTIAFLAGGTACKGKKTAAEMKAEQDKAWRETQKRKAQEYYAELVEKFPDTDYATQAKERLGVIGTPPPKAAQKPGASPATAKQ
jgi:hypothetical protein